MYHFGKRSLDELATVHPDLRLVAHESLAVSAIDFGVVQGRRTFEEQLDYFLNDKSGLDPRIPGMLEKAMHIPAEPGGEADAFDIVVAVPGRPDLAYDYNHLCYIAGVIMSTGKRLKAEGRISSTLRWGGNWDGDGIIIADQKFNDLVHFERVRG